MTTLPHMEITLYARGLTGTQYDVYERLLAEVVRPPKATMVTNLRKTTVGEVVSCEIHVKGHCHLDDAVLAALRDLLAHVPEVSVQLQHGGGTNVNLAVRSAETWADAMALLESGPYHITWLSLQGRLRLVG